MPVDRAQVVAALADRLRQEGVRVPLSATQTLARVLALTPAPAPYWAARLTLVSSRRELRVFEDVWADLVADRVVVPEVEGPEGPEGPETMVPPRARPRRAAPGAPSEQTVPWTQRRTVTAASDETGGARSSSAPLLRPSARRPEAALPFEAFDPDRLRHLDEVLREEMVRWPRRRTRREHHRGPSERIDMRRTISRARRTGWETVVLERRGRTVRQRRTVMLTDVSQSMQPYATAYLHLMRVLTRRGGAEAFAFGTGLYRLTPALERHGPADAVRQASRSVTDRFGGTRIATSLRQLMSSHHGELLRGAVCIIASDGWDSDPPEEIAAQMARLRRRAHRVVWLNPRAVAEGFEPLVRSMAAAAPYCDEVLPATTLDDLPAVMRSVGQFQSVT